MLDDEIELFHNQNFQLLRLECLKTGELFQDPYFPAESQSLSEKYHIQIKNYDEIVWKRPFEIVENPQLIVNGIKRTDPNQGDLGNCWFIAAMILITENEKIVNKLIPNDQSFDKDTYAGIFHFRFWRYEKWYDIVVDDRLPYLENEKKLWAGKNLFETNEFWVSLVEKAYAKLNGNYLNLSGGLAVNALTDFTGGIEQHFEFKSNHLFQNFNENTLIYLFDLIKISIDSGSLITCSINSINMSTQHYSILSNGLIIGHTYSITNYYILSVENTKSLSEKLFLCLRNPWGNSIESKSNIIQTKQGEFTISISHFYQYFDLIEFCHINPHHYHDFHSTVSSNIKSCWKMSFIDGWWRSKINSGGSCAKGNCKHGCYFWKNPQYIIQLKFDSSSCPNGLFTIIIALMQKQRNYHSNQQFIQIRIFKIKSNVKISTKTFYQPHQLERIASTGPYGKVLLMYYFRFAVIYVLHVQINWLVNRREVSLMLKATSGSYLIIPSMADVDQNGDFLLRIFSKDITIVPIQLSSISN